MLTLPLLAYYHLSFLFSFAHIAIPKDQTQATFLGIDGKGTVQAVPWHVPAGWSSAPSLPFTTTQTSQDDGARLESEKTDLPESGEFSGLPFASQILFVTCYSSLDVLFLQCLSYSVEDVLAFLSSPRALTS